MQSAAWLLVPGPREEERGGEGVVVSLLLAGIVAFNVFYPGSIFRQFGGHYEAGFSLVAALLLSAILHASPPGWRRFRLGVRVVLTLTVAAFVAWFATASIGFGLYGVGVAALLVLAFFSFSYYVNHRRALRLLSPPTD